jgi:hypothetical protein
MERKYKMRSVKLMVAMAAIAALVAGPVLAQEAGAAPVGEPTAAAPEAPAKATGKHHGKKHGKHHAKKHKKGAEVAPAEAAPAAAGQ